MYILIDNYDSFTYNLYQYLRELIEEPVRVVRNDATSVRELEEAHPKGIIISPGPGRPEEAGITVEVVKRLSGKVPILGVCLGHQAIGYAFGARIVQAKRIVHGKVEPILTDGKGLFRSLPNPSPFVRYHSLVVEEESLPSELEVSARSADGDVMGLRHKEFLLEGVQFHPESIGSEGGKLVLKNFLRYRREAFNPKQALTWIMARRDLSKSEAENFMEELTEGTLTPAQIAAFLVALTAKGVTGEEIAGCASVLQRKRKKVEIDLPLLDTCGTGGDGVGSFNISSFAALIASAASVPVAKHGNRAISSKSGSADFFKALGIPIELSLEQAKESLQKHCFAFLFAPLYHQAMRYAAPVRRDIGIKTIMNLLGPLVNPAGAQYQLLGVYDGALARPMAKAAALLGIKRALVVHGMDGLDEISVCAPSLLVWINEDGSLREETFDPQEMGIPRFPETELLGSDAEGNAEVALELAEGRGPEALKQAVLLNAGAAFTIYGRTATLAEGYRLAQRTLESGAVKEQIQRLRATSGLTL
ncbi:MAG: bifunctional anthranilate synthase component II/anthranilate phosphoribosyltransferase [Spirochaetales bacterium]